MIAGFFKSLNMQHLNNKDSNKKVRLSLKGTVKTDSDDACYTRKPDILSRTNENPWQFWWLSATLADETENP